MDVEEMYEVMQNEIDKAAATMKKNFGDHAEYEELKAEGDWIFMTVMEDFDPTLGDFRKRLIFMLYSRMRDYLRRKVYIQKLESRVTADTPELADDQPRGLRYDHRWSDEAREIIEYALTTPRKMNRGHIKEVFLGRGWQHRKISKAFSEIREVI